MQNARKLFWVAPASRGSISASRRNLERRTVCNDACEKDHRATLARQPTHSVTPAHIPPSARSPRFGGTPNFTRETRVLPG